MPGLPASPDLRYSTGQAGGATRASHQGEAGPAALPDPAAAGAEAELPEGRAAASHVSSPNKGTGSTREETKREANRHTTW